MAQDQYKCSLGAGAENDCPDEAGIQAISLNGNYSHPVRQKVDEVERRCSDGGKQRSSEKARSSKYRSEGAILWQEAGSGSEAE